MDILGQRGQDRTQFLWGMDDNLSTRLHSYERGRVMTHPEEPEIEMERRAAEFEKLLEQVDRLSTAQAKTRTENDAEKKKTPEA